MAPLLRASFQGLRCSRLLPSPSLFSSRELLKPPLERFKPPESSYMLRRWYGESVAVEETCSSIQTINETTGDSKTVIQAEVSTTVIDAEKLKAPTANEDKQESAAKELSATDKLSSLIMGKLRNKNSVNALKDNGSSLQMESTSPQANKISEAGDGKFTSSKANSKPPEEGSQPTIKQDKWSQVMNSMREMAAKKKSNQASNSAMLSSARSKEDETDDDFADLDLPEARNEAVASKLSFKPDNVLPPVSASRNFTPNVKPKERGMQGVNSKQKSDGSHGSQYTAHAGKPTSFKFLDSLDSSVSEEDEMNEFGKFKKSLQEGYLPMRPSRYNGFEELKKSLQEGLPPTRYNESVKNGEQWSKPMGTFSKPKPDHHDPLKSLQNSSHEAKSASGKSAAPREFGRGYVDEIEREPTYTKEVTDLLNRTTHPSYAVCIQNLPRQSNLALVKDALSLHGEVVSSFKKPTSSGLCDAFIKFKTAEAMESALISQSLSLDGETFRIFMVDAPITTVVRLSRVSADTTDSEVLSICEKLGILDHLPLKRRATGVYDVYFKADELRNMPTIINCLNEVTLHQRRWVALPAPRLLPMLRKEMLKTREGQAWHASQFGETLSRIETGLETISLLFDDLKTLAAMEDDFYKIS